jgi:hypothetical protein
LKSNFPNRKEQRQKAAVERQEKRDKRSNKQQIALIMKRCGNEDCKEIKRLREKKNEKK